MIVIISLLVVGLIFILLEMLVVPGTTVVGIVGAAMMAVAVYLGYTNYGSATGTYILIGAIVFTVSGMAIALKSNTWKKAMLGSEVSSKVNTWEEDKVKVGDEGITISRLGPMGKALINEEYYEVSSKDNLIAPETPIVVVKVDGNKIIVKSKT